MEVSGHASKISRLAPLLQWGQMLGVFASMAAGNG